MRACNRSKQEKETVEPTAAAAAAAAATMDVESSSWSYPTDVLVEILLRLPASARRRVRLVCRLWRDAVDGCTPEMRSRPKTLVCVKKSTGTAAGMRTTAAYVIDDLPAGRFRELWTGDGGVSVVGTFNGLLCLCDNREPGGAITLVNPVTGDTLAVPLLPRYSSGEMAAAAARWHEAYSFGYHPTTGRYKIVHVPCNLNPAATGGFDFHAVQVFTLGEASSWREVLLPVASSCRPGAGIISVDGTTYWLSEGAEKTLMSLDLGDDERLVVSSLPSPAGTEPGYTFRLVVVRGRLGVAVEWRCVNTASDNAPPVTTTKTEVWVLESGWWRQRFDVQGRQLPAPHFADGDHVLTVRERPAGQSSGLGEHGDGDEGSPSLVGGVVRITDRQRPAVVVGGFGGSIDRMLAYVETTEPVSIYRCGD